MKYSSLPAQTGLHVMAMLFPLWGVAAPAALTLFIVLLLRLPAHISLVSSLGIIFALLCLILGSAFFAVVFDDDQIRVSKDGLAFPLRF
jgi:hypothetical protein